MPGAYFVHALYALTYFVHTLSILHSTVKAIRRALGSCHCGLFGNISRFFLKLSILHGPVKAIRRALGSCHCARPVGVRQAHTTGCTQCHPCGLHYCPESPRAAARCAKHRKRTLFTTSPLSRLRERGRG
jgi:hypothetical protein